MNWRSSGLRLLACTAVLCSLLGLCGCYKGDDRRDESAPVVMINGQRVETMTFLTAEQPATEESSSQFQIYLQEHTPVEIAYLDTLLIDIGGHGPENLELTDYLIDQNGKIQYGRMAMEMTLPIYPSDTTAFYPVDVHTASYLSSTYFNKTDGQWRGLRVRMVNRQQEYEYVFVLRVMQAD